MMGRSTKASRLEVFLPGRIFDCFTFYNELDLLELRLNELAGVVDYFVLAEAPVTFKGNKKPLYFTENRDRFKKFSDQIIHLVVDDMPHSANPWDLEHFQRNALRRGLRQALDEDVIIISDADEIISPGTAHKLRGRQGFTQIQMTMYQYYMNLREQHGWSKVFAFSRDLLEQLPDFNWVRTNQEDAFNAFAGMNQKLEAAGWHFTYLGGPARVRDKINAFSHNEPWFQTMLEPGGIEMQAQAGFEVGNFWHLNRLCPVDESFPAYLRAHEEKYKSMGYIRDPYEAVQSLQYLLRNAYEAIRRDRGQLKLYADKFGPPPQPEPLDLNMV